jgi:hypothetical protein
MSFTVRSSKTHTQIKEKKRKLDEINAEIESSLPLPANLLKIVSYNVDPSDRYLRERSIIIKDLILLEDPDVILLQEIIMNNVYIFIDEFKKSGYKIAALDNSLPNCSYFTLSFVRNSINIIRYISIHL